ncbi:MAG: hypothetical protein K8H89_13555, partial [Flavobacteriales bacterium]|nr:hypothetical protein [Flavobacteriales bacterium]
HLAALLMLAQHRHDLRFRPFALSHCPKVQVDFAVLLSRTPDLGGAYRDINPEYNGSSFIQVQ